MSFHFFQITTKPKVQFYENCYWFMKISLSFHLISYLFKLSSSILNLHRGLSSCLLVSGLYLKSNALHNKGHCFMNHEDFFSSTFAFPVPENFHELMHQVSFLIPYQPFLQHNAFYFFILNFNAFVGLE